MCDRAFVLASRGRRAVRGYAVADLFAARGRNLDFDPDGIYSFESIYIGDDCFLGARPILLATRSNIVIGNKVMFGPGVTIRGGNHRFDIVGVATRDITDDMKRPGDDRDVVIEDDVWVGGGAVILHGVTIGRGSVIGANALIAKDVPPYSVVGAPLASVLRERFDREQIQTHEAALGGP